MYIIIIILIGLLIKLQRKNDKIKIIIGLELILIGIGINYAIISIIIDDQLGSFLSLLLLPLTGAESAILLSIIISYYPRRRSLKI